MLENGAYFPYDVPCFPPAPPRVPSDNDVTANNARAAERLTRIAAAVRARPPVLAERDGEWWEAAVALILRPAPKGGLELLFIERAMREGDPWSGQVALPGGRYDPTDTSLEDTAVRETLEEVAIDLRAHGAVFGAIDEMRPRNPMLPPVIVRPYVAQVEGALSVVHSDEVGAHFWAPLDAILDPANTKNTRILVRGFHMWRDAIHYDGRVIWGMTEQILKQFAEVIA